MNDCLGRTFTDRITGFTGVAIGHVEYITGCHQTLLAPKSSDGKQLESVWIDDQRLAVTDASRIELENGATPGFDKAAPKR